jgi:hypothetical protein
VVNLLATPNSGYTFSSWTGNVASASSASTTVTMSAPQSVTANFSAVIAPPDFSVASSTPSQSVTPGGAATYSIVVQPTGGYSGSVQLSVTSGLPADAIATFSPNPVVFGSAQPEAARPATVQSGATSILTVQTASTKLTRSRSRSWPLVAPALGLLLLLPARRLRRQYLFRLLLILALLAIAVSMVGCGGGFAMPSQSQTYTLTITGTGSGASGTATRTTTVLLTVQQ